MKGLIDEILQIPECARVALAKHKSLVLPVRVPYVGMGASYNAPLTLFYCGVSIEPVIASEYYNYLSSGVSPHGVLLSQSGESSETLWCLERFTRVTAITNTATSSLARDVRTKEIVDIAAGPEEFFSTTKTYTNTLITLYAGLGIDVSDAVGVLARRFSEYKEIGIHAASQIASYIKKHAIHGLYLVGSGPNIGTALQGALVLSETTRMSWVGMSHSQFDHGPKESAQDSVIILLDGRGKTQKRHKSLATLLTQKTNACVIELSEPATGEVVSPLSLSVQIDFLLNYLADQLSVSGVFALGSKVTKVDEETK